MRLNTAWVCSMSKISNSTGLLDRGKGNGATCFNRSDHGRLKPHAFRHLLAWTAGSMRRFGRGVRSNGMSTLASASHTTIGSCLWPLSARPKDGDRIQSSPQSRDQDLSQVDRVQLSIDVDQDLITSYQLEITDAGRTRDSVDGRTAWQPTWYLDVQRADAVVTF